MGTQTGGVKSGVQLRQCLDAGLLAVTIVAIIKETVWGVLSATSSYV